VFFCVVFSCAGQLGTVELSFNFFAFRAAVLDHWGVLSCVLSSRAAFEFDSNNVFISAALFPCFRLSICLVSAPKNVARRRCRWRRLSTVALTPLGLEIDVFYLCLIVTLIVCFGLLMLLSTRGRGDPTGCSFDQVVSSFVDCWVPGFRL
jgi:uncharacterized membrane protein YGL010W